MIYIRYALHFNTFNRLYDYTVFLYDFNRTIFRISLEI